LELERNPGTAWDVCPIILLYRQALELHLKFLVDTGGNVPKSKTDPISLCQTHSLRWLAQIVCEAIKAVGWQNDFTCEGVSNLKDFSSLVDEIESSDPVACAMGLAVTVQPRAAWDQRL
jgi:hypothetical protein